MAVGVRKVEAGKDPVAERPRTPSRGVGSAGGEGHRRCAKRLLMLSATGAKCLVADWWWTGLQSWEPSAPPGPASCCPAERDAGCLKQCFSSTVLRHTSVPGEGVWAYLEKKPKRSNFTSLVSKQQRYNSTVGRLCLKKEARVCSAPSTPPSRSALCATTQGPTTKVSFHQAIK